MDSLKLFLFLSGVINFSSEGVLKDSNRESNCLFSSEVLIKSYMKEGDQKKKNVYLPWKD